MIIRVIVTTEELDEMQLSNYSLEELIIARLDAVSPELVGFVVDVQEKLNRH